MTREITGWHVTAMFAATFGVIIAVNLTLAFQAVRTFPGLEVKNSYVASQSFDADRASQEALGWTGALEARAGQVMLTLDAEGAPAPARIVDARLGRTTHTAADRQLQFEVTREGWVANAPDLEAGAWSLWLLAEAPDGTAFRHRFALWVAE